MNYDKNNLFAKILRGELSSEKVFEDDEVLVIKDKFPDKNWKTHLLCLPKNEFINFTHFIEISSDDQITFLFKKIDKIAKNLCLTSYQLLINNGEAARQEIMHLHIHIKSHESIIKL